MREQCAVMEQFNDFLRRRGLKASFVADKLGISKSVMYNFKAGIGLLTHKQLQALQGCIEEYDRRMDGFLEGGGKANETEV